MYVNIDVIMATKFWRVCFKKVEYFFKKIDFKKLLSLLADAEFNFQQCLFLSELHILQIFCLLSILLYSDQVFY